MIALVHGFAGDPSTWDEVIARWTLAEPPHAIALPGHGGGAVRDDWAANLAAVPDCEIAVGYSLGARVVLGLVASGRCRFGVLIGCNPGLDEGERAARRATDASWARMLRTDGIAAFADAWTAQPLFATQARVSAERRAARRTRRLALDPLELARSLETMGLAEMPDCRGAIDHRVALIAGADDAKYVAIARMLGARCELIDGSGHDPTLEQPAALAAAIARAITERA